MNGTVSILQIVPPIVTMTTSDTTPVTGTFIGEPPCWLVIGSDGIEKQESKR